MSERKLQPFNPDTGSWGGNPYETSCGGDTFGPILSPDAYKYAPTSTESLPEFSQFRAWYKPTNLKGGGDPNAGKG